MLRISKYLLETQTLGSNQVICLQMGVYDEGPRNTITDVKGIKVATVDPWRYMKEHHELNGVTFISIPSVTTRSVPAGGFILNGIGEMIGLTQVMECGWLESPIALTNTASLGDVYSSLFTQLATAKRVRQGDLIIPVVGETDNSFLSVVPHELYIDLKALYAYPPTYDKLVTDFKQGATGGGYGMMTFGFSGGTGSASRVVTIAGNTYTVGVLTQSNFGELEDLYLQGKAIGLELSRAKKKSKKKRKSSGSAIVVVATDAPLLPGDLTRLAKRAALGLGRAGSYAATDSGEIIIAFSVNRSLDGVDNEVLDNLFAMTMEATEESVFQAVFHATAIKGRNGHVAEAIPHPAIAQLLS